MKRDLYQEVTSRIIQSLEAGTPPWARGWQTGTSIPMNAATNRPYSGINVLLFWLAPEQGWQTARFLTFKQAQALGGNVRKGEKSTRVYFFKQLTVADNRAPEGERTIPMLREYCVFNVAQCDGLPDEVMTGNTGATRNPDQRMIDADTFIQSTGADFREGAGKPCYVPSQDFITVPAWSAFKSAPDFYADSFHELTHWTGHKSRLDRDFKGRFDKHAYAAEELVAEIGAAYLCAEFGLDMVSNHAAYMQSWLKLLKDDPRAIFTAASKATAAAQYLRDLANAAPLAKAA